jgi:hypothetical protein
MINYKIKILLIRLTNYSGLAKGQRIEKVDVLGGKIAIKSNRPNFGGGRRRF